MQGPWEPPPDEAIEPPRASVGCLSGLWANLRAGLRLALFLPVSRENFRLTRTQAGIFILVAAALVVGLQAAAGFGYRLRLFMPESHALAIYAAVLVVLCVFACLFGRLHRNAVGGAGVIIVVSSAAILPTLALSAYMSAIVALILASAAGGLWWLGYVSEWMMLPPILWFVAAFIRSISLACGVGVLRAVALSAVPLLVLTLPQHAEELLQTVQSEPIAGTEDLEDEDTASARIDVEQTFYAQPGLVDSAGAALAPERPGVTDLYLVAFGGYASQNVFRSEVEKVTALFDERFDTKGRSVALVNNTETVERTPIASATNLKHLLARVAAHMNREEDVLFLFLTSHGSPNSLAVEFMPLPLDSISPAELDRMLDDAGIKWRVVVVSACYSGSFIDPLKDENSLIITAARADRTSFGCSNENEYTYFGDAYFNQELRRQSSFIAAFDSAAATVAKRERAESLEPSEPQIYVGPAIRAKLEEFEKGLSAGGAFSRNPGG